MKCYLDKDNCVTLLDILTSFNTYISVDNAWAFCYQCAKCFDRAWKDNRNKCVRVIELKQVFLHSDGKVHFKTICPENDKDSSRGPVLSEKQLVSDLGCIIYKALDFGVTEYNERIYSADLEELMAYMLCEDDCFSLDLERLQETDDEGIERDGGECDAGPSSLGSQPDIGSRTLDTVMQMCVKHVGPTADMHYRNVCKAFVAEALELSVFLEKVSSGSGARDLYSPLDSSSCSDLDNLKFSDWARFWVQVIGQLRMGVTLKKVDLHSRPPIEYELTPYEILMDDIRSQRYTLRKVMVDGDIPHRVKKDAHAVILEFIRSRPPLRKASDRKLPPLKRAPTPREQLLDSIKRGRTLKPTNQPKIRLKDNHVKDNQKRCTNENELKPTRRLIKVDFSSLQMGDLDDDDDDDDDIDLDDYDLQEPVRRTVPSTGTGSCTGNTGSTASTVTATATITTPAGVYKRTGSHGPAATLTHDEYHRFCDATLESYDLATQCPSRRASMRRHTVVACVPELPAQQCRSVPPSQPTSRPGSRLSQQSCSETDSAQLGTTLPEMSWSRGSLQDDLLQSKQWQEAMSLDDRLSLTLEEIVHIRSVLTKAELESLPIEGHVKEDVEKRRVCFLCLKTRFGIFGPWGQRCKLCNRTICARCHSKMRIPTEHFSNVPVVLLSPTIISSPEDDVKDTFPRSLMQRLMVPDNSSKVRNSVGSAPNSPNMQRMNGDVISSSVPGSRVESRMASSMEGPISLSTASSPSFLSERRNRMLRSRTLGRQGGDRSVDRLKGVQMVVCHDCKTMVLQIIKSSRTNRTALRNNALRNLTLNLSSVY